MSFQISQLSAVPHFADQVADRGWQAWWTQSAVSLSHYRAGLEPMLRSRNSIPFALVAHQNETYLGSVLVIENDLEERPNLSPWVAALWVEAEFRCKGIARQLLDDAVQRVFDLGRGDVYLCAEPPIGPYYLARGWALLERSVGGLDVFVRKTSQTAS
jgi:GNAT superfamily N-acetyltransferase